MQLYLVQHGAARSEAEDPQRGLSQEGRCEVEELADFLEPLKLPMVRIEHSGKLRARQTADILANRIHPPEGTREISGIAPNDDVKTLSSRMEKESTNLMIVGHLPHLSRLVARLMSVEGGRDLVQFQNGGMVRLDRREGIWVIGWMIVPELLVASSPSR